MGIKEYRVFYRKPEHNDEWENQYEADCIKDENGNMVKIKSTVYSSDSGYISGWGEFAIIPPEHIIRIEDA